MNNQLENAPTTVYRKLIPGTLFIPIGWNCICLKTQSAFLTFKFLSGNILEEEELVSLETDFPVIIVDADFYVGEDCIHRTYV